MRVVIANVTTPFVYGGAEILAEELEAALSDAGHDVELLSIPWQWSPPERIVDEMVSFRLLDLTTSRAGEIDLLLALKFPAYLIEHPNKIVWLLHQHQPAHNLWLSQVGLSQAPNGSLARRVVHSADRYALSEAKRVFAISDVVANRLASSCSIEAEVVMPPPRRASAFRCEAQGEYLLFPGRITPSKRPGLVLDALAETKNPVRVVSTGLPDDSKYLEEMTARARSLGVRDRIEWKGWTDHDELVSLFARCSGVLFPPYEEDYGFVTAEAMLSSKPVITCRDSGGPTDLVSDGETGWICDPSSTDVARAMDELWSDPSKAAARGSAGRERYEEIGSDWSTVVERLLG